jgi:GMP synthase-like glutamine amidotransferase
VIDEVFQTSELVEPYRVSSSIDLEENSNFHVFDDSLVVVDAEELNVVLSSSGPENVDEEDDNHIEECVLIIIQLRTKMKIMTKYD